MKNMKEKQRSANQTQEGKVSDKRKSEQIRRGGGEVGGGGGSGSRHRISGREIAKNMMNRR